MWKSFKRKPTEEDTFMALRGYTFEEISVAIEKEQCSTLNMLIIGFAIIFGFPDVAKTLMKIRSKVIEDCGWTYEQYIDEIVDRALKEK